ECLAQHEVMSSALRSLECAWFPAIQLPALRRILHEHAGNDCDDEIADAEVSKCAQDADALNESRRHRRGDECAGSESADRDASDESSFIGKPFYQHGHGNDVTKAETDAADQSVTDV